MVSVTLVLLDRVEYFKDCWSHGIVTHNSFKAFAWNDAKQQQPKKDQKNPVLEQKRLADERCQSRMSSQKGHCNNNSHSLQLWRTDKHLSIHKTLNLDMNSRQSNQVPLRSVINRNLRTKQAQTYWHWIVDWIVDIPDKMLFEFLF